MSLLVLLLFGSEGLAKAPTIAIVDLNLDEGTGAPLIDSIRQDLSVAGYVLSEGGEILRGLQGPLATSDNTRQEAEEHLQSAQRAYEKFELDKALVSLAAANDLLLSAATEMKVRPLLAKGYLLAGLIRVAQDRSDKAINNFRLAHRLSPRVVKLNAADHRPSVVKLYREAVRRNTDAKPTRLRRDWTPKDASLRVDGRLVEAKKKISQGPHILTLKAEGYASESVALALAADASHSTSLQALSLTEALRALRKLAASESSQSTVHFQKIAKRSGVESLVLIRSGEEGPRAALYHLADESLSSWVQVASVRWESLLSLEGKSAARIALTPAAKEQEARPWYATLWGGGLLVGGTAVAGAALYFALSASDSSDSKGTIDEWCFGSCP